MKLKAAVIGVGSMGSNHARVYRELDNVDLVAIADQHPETAAKVGARFAVPYFIDYVEMIEQCQPDVVTLAAPTILHAQIASDLMKRSINVLIEKPIATSVEEAERLIEIADRYNVVLAVGHIERFNPAVVELRYRLQNMMAGQIYKIQTQRLSPYPARIRDAGVVIDLATHDIDLMRYLIGDDIVRLYGETQQSINSDREDVFTGIMRFRNGTIGFLDVNWITPKKVRRLMVTGARGLFVCDLLSQELFFHENGSNTNQWDSLSILGGVSEGDVLGIRIERFEPLAAELNNFLDAVRNNTQPAVTGRDGLETLRIALEFMQSGKHSEVIRSSERIAL